METNASIYSDGFCKHKRVWVIGSSTDNVVIPIDVESEKRKEENRRLNADCWGNLCDCSICNPRTIASLGD